MDIDEVMRGDGPGCTNMEKTIKERRLESIKMRSNLTALWSEKILGMISIFFAFTKARFMAQDVIYPGECSVSP